MNPINNVQCWLITWANVDWISAAAMVDTGISCALACCWKNWISPVADWERTCTAIISACMVDKAAWSNCVNIELDTAVVPVPVEEARILENMNYSI